MKDIQIVFPTEADWHWIIERHAETAWASLTSELQAAVSIQVVRESLSEQTAKFRAEHEVTNQVFIARNVDEYAGYVWVGQVKSAFIGAMQAYILNIYVADEFRGKGIGTRLMAQAEDWARQQKLERIGLSVAAHNKPAIGLYENLAYKIETLRMFKDLGGRFS
ncbi:MAG TPA: GNAT family N-acetyltransferase [Anaerolineales bacterium]|nr:GNAT family N-acetyltransferase [Anaerolineales bacterium]